MNKQCLFNDKNNLMVNNKCNFITLTNIKENQQCPIAFFKLCRKFSTSSHSF